MNELSLFYEGSGVDTELFTSSPRPRGTSSKMKKKNGPESKVRRSVWACCLICPCRQMFLLREMLLCICFVAKLPSRTL